MMPYRKPHIRRVFYPPVGWIWGLYLRKDSPKPCAMASRLTSFCTCRTFNRYYRMRANAN